MVRSGLLSCRMSCRKFIPCSTASWEANARAGGLSRGFGRPCHPSAARDLVTRFRKRGSKIPRCARDDRKVDEYVVVHNNTFMKRAALPVILLNTVRSTGATG